MPHPIRWWRQRRELRAQEAELTRLLGYPIRIVNRGRWPWP